MRTDAEVLKQLLDFARSEEMVRAVLLNGSRVNPNVTKDLFCDYDVIFVVTDPQRFLDDQAWIRHFGELIIMQQNEWVEAGAMGYIFLMLFTDGVRIDLSFRPFQHLDAMYEDTLSVVLLDKDQRIRPLPAPTDTGYFTKKPDRKTFDAVLNEFWWCSTNVAKGLWRDELCYAKYMFDAIMRECLLTMLAWYIGIRHDWLINSGKYGRWLETYLPEEIWESVEKTYVGADEDAIWNALFEAGRLVGIIGVDIAQALQFEYPMRDDQCATTYWQRVRSLPKDAESSAELTFQ